MPTIPASPRVSCLRSARTLLYSLSLLSLSALAACGTPARATGAPGTRPSRAPAAEDSAATVQWFQRTEQSLMDGVTAGDRHAWQEVLDSNCVITDEEGRVLSKRELLNGIQPLPAGLSGSITVRDLTVQRVADVAIVRFLADEHETVFGQELATKYRTTDTFRRVGDEWTMLASHTSDVTQDPPAQSVAASGFRALAGTYQLLPDGWTFHVVARDGKLYGGRDPSKLRELIPLTSEAFVLHGSLGEWLFARDGNGRSVRIINIRKFEPLVWTRVGD